MSQNPANPLFDYIGRLQLELNLKFRNKSGIKEETEMNPEIWARLPQELIALILAHLPTLITVKFRLVCKRWKYLLSHSAPTYKLISSTISPCSSPAFLFAGMPWIINNSSVADKELYLLQLLPTFNTCKLSLDFLVPEDSVPPESVSVVASCKSVLCCCYSMFGTLISFYLCNPVTRTFKKLPNPMHLNRWHFIGLAFDISTMRCILIKGINQISHEKNHMVLEMYDSDTNAWTQFNTINVALSICPSGKGVFSGGKFYWINEKKVQVGFSTTFRFDIAVFNVAQNSWDVIKQPVRQDAPDSEFLCFWQLTGCDGNIVLAYSKDLCLWKLKEDGEDDDYRWSELQLFPRSMYDEVISNENILNDLSRLRRLEGKRIGYLQQRVPPRIIVNSCGYVLIHLHKNKLAVFDAHGRFIESIHGHALMIFEQSEPRPYAYEINNVLWP